MPTYSYTAVGTNRKTIKDSIDSPSLEQAKSTLRRAGYTIIEIGEQSILDRDLNIGFLDKPKAKDMAIFCRQFVSILRAGVPISVVLNMLGQQTENKKLASAIRNMQTDVEKGDSLALSMRRHPKIFNSMLVNMVASGEESGNLESSFSQMETYFDKMKKTGAAVTKAMIYPCVLIVVMIIVLIVMMTVIVPKFVTTFTDMGAELPMITQIVVNTSHFMQKWIWLIAIVIIGLVLGGIAFGRTNVGMHAYGWISRKIPVVKELTVKSASAMFARTLSLLLGSGLTLTDSLELVANNMKNIWYKEAVTRIRAQVSEGWQLNVAVRESKLFPPMVYNLIAIGEETGDLQGMLEKTADYYDDEVDGAVQKLLSLMEPIIILFMAFFVVVIVLSIYMPMLKMTSAYDQYLN